MGEARSSLAESVKEQLEEMAKSYQTVSSMEWVNATKIEAAKKKQDEFEALWQKKQDLQTKIPDHEAPVYTAREIQEQIDKVNKEWEKLKKTKKPKEKKVPNKTNDTKTKKGAPKEEPMPADQEQTKKEL